jgi:hypothetical protein
MIRIGHRDNSYKTSDGVWFNEHPNGSADPEAAPVCANDIDPMVTEPLSGGVLWMGDSDTDYWNNTGWIAPGSYNVAVGGFTCEEVLNDFDTMVETFDPITIIMTCGENDLPDATVEDTFARFSTIVDKASVLGIGLIAFGTKDEPDTSEPWQKYVEYNSKIVALAESLSRSLVFVDANAGFKAVGNHGSLYAEDGLHMSSEGYAYWDTWASLALAEIEEGTNPCIIWRSGDCVSMEQPSLPIAEPTPSASSAVVGISSFLVIWDIAITCTY